MKYFTKEWYIDYYMRNYTPNQYNKYRSLALKRSMRDIRESCQVDMEKIPPESPLHQMAYHDAILTSVEISQTSVTMHLDTTDSICKWNRIRFENEVSIKGDDISLIKNPLELFQTEEEYCNGIYRFGILFRNWYVQINNNPVPMVFEIYAKNIEADMEIYDA